MFYVAFNEFHAKIQWDQFLYKEMLLNITKMLRNRPKLMVFGFKLPYLLIFKPKLLLRLI